MFWDMEYVDYVYDIVKAESNGMDALYRDYIIRIVGTFGLNALIERNLVEPCGTVFGRQLYALCDKK